MRTSILFFLNISISLSLFQCAGVASRTSKPNEPASKINKVMIIAITNQPDVRSMYEKELSYRMRTKGLNTVISVNLDENKSDLLTKEEILEIVKKENIDGVITMKLKDISTKESYTTSDRYISDPFESMYLYNYIDTYYNSYAWKLQQNKTVTIEATLFEVSTEKPVYHVETSMKNVSSGEELAGNITEQFSKEFKGSSVLIVK